MSSITYVERQLFEDLLGMSSGYVLDFTNQSFQEFILDTTGKDIYIEMYSEKGDSKAKRLRAFLRLEPDHVVVNLLEHLLDLACRKEIDTNVVNNCQKVIERLKQGTSVLESDALEIECGPTTEMLLKAIRLALEHNEPQQIIDRLHTLLVIRTRKLCERHQLAFDRKEPLHSLFGKYVKHLISSEIVQSKIAERLLKSNIKILDDFNDARNNQSLAHDNELLSQEESHYILNQITALLRFVNSIEELHFRNLNDETLSDAEVTSITEIRPIEDEDNVTWLDTDDDFCGYCYLEIFPGQQCPNCGQFNP